MIKAVSKRGSKLGARVLPSHLVEEFHAAIEAGGLTVLPTSQLHLKHFFWDELGGLTLELWSTFRLNVSTFGGVSRVGIQRQNGSG